MADVILGIDPGSRCTGYALVVFEHQRIEGLELGAWRVRRCPDRASSLAELAQQAERWISEREPAVAVVESLFHHRNVRSALVLSEARGALLAVLGRLGIPVVEYSPAEIKQTICGFGAATKGQVRAALARTVPGVRPEQVEGQPEDATDALSMAICHRVRSALRSRGAVHR